MTAQFIAMFLPSLIAGLDFGWAVGIGVFFAILVFNPVVVWIICRFQRHSFVGDVEKAQRINIWAQSIVGWGIVIMLYNKDDLSLLLGG